MEPEIDLIRLPAGEWQEMLSAAAELDLIRGGYYRARAAGILFYCSPDNAPERWNGGFPEGSPDLPRAYVGEAEVREWEGPDQLVVRLLVSNWGAVRDVKQAYDQGEYRGRFQEFVRDQEAALRGRQEDRAWLRLRFKRLQEHARGSLIADG